MQPGNYPPGSAPSPADTQDPAGFGPQAALECLAAALDSGDYATTLTTGPGRLHLSVTNRHAQIGDDIWADNRAYWWSWGEWIAPAGDPAAAARRISVVLRALPAGRS